METVSWKALLCLSIERGCRHKIAFDLLFSTETFEVLSQQGSCRKLGGLVIEERDVVFLFGAVERGTVVCCTEADRISFVVKDHSDVCGGGGGETLENPTVGVEGIRISKVPFDEL